MNKEVREVSCKETLSVQTHRILPAYTNSHGDLFGGQLLFFLDNVASISQTRLTKMASMTASIDNVNFLAPLPEGNSVCIECYITGTGTSSVEVFAKIIGEDLINGNRYMAATSFLTFVILPEHRENFVMPNIIPESDEEKYVCAGYERRKSERIKQRKFDQDMQKNLTLERPWIK